MAETVDCLEQLGHEVFVETSDLQAHGHARVKREPVYRSLPIETNVLHYRPLTHILRHPLTLRRGINGLKRRLELVQPDIIFVWGMWLFSPAFAKVAEDLFPSRVVYSFADYWPIEPDCHEAYWNGDDGTLGGQLFRWLLAPIALSRFYRPVTAADLSYGGAICCSQYVLRRLRDGGLNLANARVILSGIDTSVFRPGERLACASRLRLICLGGFAEHKGAHTIVKALGLLNDEEILGVDLTIVGHGHPDYKVQVEDLANKLGVAQHIQLIDAVDRRAVPTLLREYDSLVLATLTDEPLSRAVMEGMATGLVVVATETGGTSEMIDSDKDGLLYVAGDSLGLANHIRRVKRDVQLRRRIGHEARRRALNDFSRERMVSEIESYLTSMVTASERE